MDLIVAHDRFQLGDRTDIMCSSLQCAREAGGPIRSPYCSGLCRNELSAVDDGVLYRNDAFINDNKLVDHAELVIDYRESA